MGFAESRLQIWLSEGYSTAGFVCAADFVSNSLVSVIDSISIGFTSTGVDFIGFTSID